MMPVMPLFRPAIFEADRVIRARHLGDHVLEAIHREVEVEIVHLAGEKLELAAQLRPQGRPIVAGIAPQVETMLAHIADDLLVYVSGLPVIEPQDRKSTRLNSSH